jgi:hypothetical protein
MCIAFLIIAKDNLVKFVYKLGENWQTRAWDPVFKTAGSAPDAAMILGLFSQKNLKINIDRKLFEQSVTYNMSAVKKAFFVYFNNVFRTGGPF